MSHTLLLPLELRSSAVVRGGWLHVTGDTRAERIERQALPGAPARWEGHVQRSAPLLQPWPQGLREIHGATGVSQWTPLSRLYANQRTLRLADGPDEVHWHVVGRAELQRWVEDGASDYDPKKRFLEEEGGYEGLTFSGP